jgi:hypothetical protein
MATLLQRETVAFEEACCKQYPMLAGGCDRLVRCS